MNHSRIVRFVFTWIVLLSVPQVALAQVKHALLIGINIYTPAGRDASANAEQSVNSVTAGGKQPRNMDSRFSGTVAWQNGCSVAPVRIQRNQSIDWSERHARGDSSGSR
jgi:hypothetical protein